MDERRKIGFWTCTALVVGNTIGMGIFLLPASLAPYGFNATIGWCITVAGCIALARVFARLARDLPHADGPYGYVRGTLGELPAYVAMWCYWVSIWITNAALATGVVAYIRAAIPELAHLQPSLFALALLWTFVGVNLLGVRTGGGVQLVTTALKLLPMLAIALLGAWLLVDAPRTYVAQLPATPITLRDSMAASTIALFAMLGIEAATVPASRVENPGRTIPRATLVGTLVTAAIYLVVSTVPMLLLPAAELANAPAPFALLMDRFVGEGVGRWLAVFVVVSGLGALNGWTLLVGELTRTMADNGVLPAFLSRNNRRGAPAFALVATGLLASAMILMNYSKSLVNGFTVLTRVVTAANLPLYLCCSIALAVLWMRGRRLRDPAVRGLLSVAALGTVYSIFAFFGMGREAFLLALVLAAAGLPPYLLFMRYLRRRASRSVP